MALESLPAGRSFSRGAIGGEFGLHPSHAPRVDEVLIRLGIASDDGGQIIIASSCLASLRHVFQTAGVLYCAVLDQSLSNVDARAEFTRRSVALMCTLERSGYNAPAAVPEWAALLDALEDRCRNPLLRGLIADVRLQMAFFSRPFVENFTCDDGIPGVASMCDGIRDNDPLIAVEGFEMIWRALDRQLAQMALVASARRQGIGMSETASGLDPMAVSG